MPVSFWNEITQENQHILAVQENYCTVQYIIVQYSTILAALGAVRFERKAQRSSVALSAWDTHCQIRIISTGGGVLNYTINLYVRI